jgi:hypothetical protein
MKLCDLEWEITGSGQTVSAGSNADPLHWIDPRDLSDPSRANPIRPKGILGLTCLYMIANKESNQAVVHRKSMSGGSTTSEKAQNYVDFEWFISTIDSATLAHDDISDPK